VRYKRGRGRMVTQGRGRLGCVTWGAPTSIDVCSFMAVSSGCGIATYTYLRITEAIISSIQQCAESGMLVPDPGLRIRISIPTYPGSRVGSSVFSKKCWRERGGKGGGGEEEGKRRRGGRGEEERERGKRGKRGEEGEKEEKGKRGKRGKGERKERGERGRRGEGERGREGEEGERGERGRRRRRGEGNMAHSTKYSTYI